MIDISNMQYIFLKKKRKKKNRFGSVLSAVTPPWPVEIAKQLHQLSQSSQSSTSLCEEWVVPAEVCIVGFLCSTFSWVHQLLTIKGCKLLVLVIVSLMVVEQLIEIERVIPQYYRFLEEQSRGSIAYVNLNFTSSSFYIFPGIVGRGKLSGTQFWARKYYCHQIWRSSVLVYARI